MTRERSFKRRVRERMSKTGESYAAARTHVSHKRDRVEAARGRLSATADRPADDRIEAATGKSWDAWFSILDRWDARNRSHREIAAHLVEDRGVPGWWAQSITVYYERSRGMRLKHQQADGFSVSASKTIAVPADVALDAFVNPRVRRRWLTDGSITRRPTRAANVARFDWDGGATRVVVSVEPKGPAKTTVAVAHEKLPDPDGAETAKAAWRARLTNLKSFLEGR